MSPLVRYRECYSGLTRARSSIDVKSLAQVGELKVRTHASVSHQSLLTSHFSLLTSHLLLPPLHCYHYLLTLADRDPRPDPPARPPTQTIGIVALGLGMATDVMTSAALCWFLRNLKTGFAK